jgi:hypothetical protein
MCPGFQYPLMMYRRRKPCSDQRKRAVIEFSSPREYCVVLPRRWIVPHCTLSEHENVGLPGQLFLRASSYVWIHSGQFPDSFAHDPHFLLEKILTRGER